MQRRGEHMHAVSDAIRCNQVQSGALRCTQVHSGALRCNQLHLGHRRGTTRPRRVVSGAAAQPEGAVGQTVPDEGNNQGCHQRSSAAMRGHQRQSDLRRVERLMREAIKAIIRGHRTYGVWNANSMRWPSCSALSRREERPVASYAESSPPKTRMVTCGEERWRRSEHTCMLEAARPRRGWSPRTG